MHSRSHDAFLSAEHLPVGPVADPGGPLTERLHGLDAGLGIHPVVDRLERGGLHRIGHRDPVGLRIAPDVLRLLTADIDFYLHTPPQYAIRYERMHA